MPRNFTLVHLLIAALLSACGAAPEAKKIETPKFEFRDPTLGILACNKGEDSLAISAEALENTRIVEDKAQMGVVETRGCDGKVIKKSRGRMNSMNRKLMIPPPPGLNAPVSQILIENQRTCLSDSVKSNDSSTFSDTFEDANGELHELPVFSKARSNGLLKLRLKNLGVFTGLGIEVRPGKNLMQLTYLAENKEVLAKTEMLVRLHLTEVETTEVKVVTECKGTLEVPK